MTSTPKQEASTCAEMVGSVDSAVQRTNDDSVVSKRSAVYHGYTKDPYLRFFVRKLSRRSPLINRGYYLRMLVITDVVTRCVQHLQEMSRGPGAAPVQVVSLGAGYDTLAMRLRGQPQFNNVHFYEVDFPAVMESKAELVRTAPEGSFPADLIAKSDGELVKLYGVNFHAIGIDLRDAERGLVRGLMDASPDFSPANPTVLYAECVMQYMPPTAAAELIRHVSDSFPRAIFVAYDQVNPADSFGEVMQQALRAKGSPLLSLADSPNGRAMIRRAVAQGMQEARFANFHDLSRYYLTGEERRRVEVLEPFDESEEWCEMCEHYGITMATTSRAIGMPDLPAFSVLTTECEETETRGVQDVVVRAEKWTDGRFGFERWGSGHAFAEKLSCGDVLIVSFGGFSAVRCHRRTNTVYVHSLRDGECGVICAPNSVEPPELVHHTMSRIEHGIYVVLGGRTNPANVTMDAYLLQLHLSDLPQQTQKPHVVASWSKLAPIGEGGELPEARYRHTAVTVAASEDIDEAKTSGVVGSNGWRIFLFGGRAAAGYLLDDAWLATVSNGTIYWKSLALLRDVPPRCCSSAMVPLPNTNTVLLSGGLLVGDVCEESLWRVDWVTGVCCKLPCTISPRFSHAMCHVQVDGAARVLVLGGSTCHPREQMQSGVLLDPATGEIVSVLSLPPHCPTWTRHCCIALGEGLVAVLGGGFTCFSFGTFASKPLFLLLGDKPSGLHALKPQDAPRELLRDPSCFSPPPPPLTQRAAGEVQSYSAEAFLSLVRQPSHPVVFRGVDMGSCVNAWCSPSYLKEAEGSKIVSVHAARATNVLDFVKKNFSFRHVSFADLVDHCTAAKTEGETWYLRSVAFNMKSERANFWNDFPGLGKDFVLPPAVAAHVEPRMHQACLRLSAPPMQLWTHYDVMDNVLCQVVGRKRVVLFPPGEYNNLYMSGSSSAVLNVDKPDLIRFPRFADACRKAVEVVLEPGDMLFIPSLWFHHVTTMDGSYSISVNVFFERFPHEDYDKNDLYGNKDLPAVVRLRTRIVDQVTNLLSHSATVRTSDGMTLDSEFVEFALRQAIQEMEEIADNMTATRRGASLRPQVSLK